MLSVSLDAHRVVDLIGWAAVPAPRRLANADMCRLLGLPADLAGEVESMLGTRSRYTCMDFTDGTQVATAADMAAAAVRGALDVAGLDPPALDAIVGASTLPDLSCPSIAVSAQKVLGLPGGLTFDCSGGCGAFGQALVVALQLLQTGSARTAAVVASETLTRHVRRAQRPWEALAFGDGAAAMILSTAQRGGFTVRRYVLDTVADLGGCRDEIMTIPLTAAGTPRPIQHRADLAAIWGAHYLAHAVESVRGTVPIPDLYLCPHQPSRRVLEAARQRLRLPSEQVAAINAETANLSNASTGFAFSRRFADGPARHQWTVLAPIGAGLTYAAFLLERRQTTCDAS